MEIEPGLWYDAEGIGEVYVVGINARFSLFDTERPQLPAPTGVHVRLCREVDKYGAMPPFFTREIHEFADDAERMEPQPDYSYRGDGH
jgi:hypothetical protein